MPSVEGIPAGGSWVEVQKVRLLQHAPTGMGGYLVTADRVIVDFGPATLTPMTVRVYPSDDA